MSLTRHGRRCMESGRATAISRHIRLSRFAFRTVTGEGDWPGFTRASW
jgi:ribosomal protein S14